MTGVLLAARLAVALVLLVAALAKLADRSGSRSAVEGFGVPGPLAGPVAALLPVAELAAAVLLLITATSRIGAGLALGLFALFSAGITRSLIRGEAPDCHCFGRLHSEPAGPRTLARNLLLAALTALTLAGGPGTSATAWIGRLSAAGLAGLVGGVAVGVVLSGAAGLVLSLLRRHGELLLRVDRLEQALAERGIVIPQPAARPAGLAVGEPAPELGIPDLDGQLVTLESLSADSNPVLLTFTDPGCGPCSALLPQIAIWQREHAGRLRIALVSRGGVEANLAHAREHGVADVLVQAADEVSQRYRVEGTPSAVLVTPQRTIASPLHAGAEAISALVGSVTTPPALKVHHAAPSVGQPAPDVTLRALDGTELPLSSQLNGRTAVLFWNPGCGFCERMLPELQRVDEAQPDGAPSVVVISTGDAEQNRAMELRSPVLLDGSFAAGRAFGATGTPSAVLVEDGRIASEIVVGAPSVLELVEANPAAARAR